MIQTAESLAELYEADETAWLEAMAGLIAEGRHAELDYPHLQDYLTDLANRDRREVVSRLRFFLAHLLKWTHHPEDRTGKWTATILRLQFDLEDILESATLRNYAESELAAAYEDAVGAIAMETGVTENWYPKKCPWTVAMLLSEDLLTDEGTPNNLGAAKNE